MSVTSDTRDTQHVERLPNINMCRLCVRESSDSRRNLLQHRQGKAKVHQKRMARAKKQLLPSKRRRSEEGDNNRLNKKATRQSEPSIHRTSGALTWCGTTHMKAGLGNLLTLALLTKTDRSNPERHMCQTRAPIH